MAVVAMERFVRWKRDFDKRMLEQMAEEFRRFQDGGR